MSSRRTRRRRKKVTDGSSATTFSPTNNCKNSHILTFIYRALGEPGKTGAGTWYTDAENLANTNDVLSGMDAPYATEDQYPRVNAVYYLWKALK